VLRMATEPRVLNLAVLLALVVGVASAFGGPWLMGHRDRPAKEPFAYALPEGFNAVPSAPGSSERSAYAHTQLSAGTLIPNITITHIGDMSVFDDAKLSGIAAGMPQFFAQSKIKWTEVRHAQVRRHDGALVGLLEGENEIVDEHFRSLQLSFPDNTGVSLVTANFSTSEAPHWEPVFEATIETSRGVASRGVETPVWMRVAWGLGGAIVALLMVFGYSRKPAPVASPGSTDEPKPG
jgi:hypothetical protein